MNTHWRSALPATILLSCLSQPVAAQSEDHERLIAACTQINHDYALARDNADREAFETLFAEDAVFTMQGEAFVGRDRIVARLDLSDAQTFARLLITSVDITPTGAETATGVTYFMMFMAAGDPTPPITQYTLFMGEYHDSYSLTPEGCKFTSRETRPLFVGENLAPTAADRVFHNGRIVTMDSDFSVVSALAVEDGRVLATGSDAEILAMADADSVVVDLSGRMLLPGLIDSHLHPDQASVSEFGHPVPAMLTVADVLDYVSSRAEVLPEGDWIWVRTVLTPRLRERRYPTRAELDEAAPRHPAVFAPYIYYPKASMNSLALERLGIDRDFEGVAPTDIERDASTGEPTGLIRNHTRYIDDPGEVDLTNDSERAQAFRNLMRVYNSVGLTSVGDRKATPASMQIYTALAAENALTVRFSLMHLVDTASGRDVDEIVADIARLGLLREQVKDPMLDLIGVKTFVDGGITSGTAYMLEPWGTSEIFAISDPQYRGNLVLSGERLERVIRAAADSGLQFTGHVVGDAAITELVRAYVAVSSKSSIRHFRPSLTHANFITEQVIGQMAEWGIVADIQPAWLYLDSHNLLDQWGEDRLRHFQPLKSLFDAGVLVAGGSDHWHRLDSHSATNPFNPFLGMWIALKREPRYVGHAVNGEQALTREQALRLYTTNAAYILFREEEVGSLEPGKYADMIVVDRDILESELDDIRETRVLHTYVNGEPVYDAQSQQ